MRYDVEIKGLEQLQKDFAKAPEVTTREVSRAINSSLVRYQGTAKSLSPVDTGRLRSSISVFPARRAGGAIEGSVRTGTHYAVYQELGTSRGVRPRLYMKGSVDANQEHTDRAFDQAATNIAHELAGPEGSMSSTYAQVGQAIYDFVTEIDISAATPEGEATLVWKDTLNRPPKVNELNVYPALVVAPASDEQQTGDTETDFDTVTYSVFIIYSYAEASFAEALLIDLADIVRTELRSLRANPELLMAAAYDVSFRGEWGGTGEQGERYYKLDITVHVHEALLSP